MWLPLQNRRASRSRGSPSSGGDFPGIYLYGWDRIPPRAHLFAGVLVAVSGAVSGITVVIANAWMNTPTGFQVENGVVTHVDPIAAMLNPAALSQTIHMTLAAYAATGFAVAGIHAFLLLKDPANAFHRRAIAIALLVGGPAAALQPLSGDIAACQVARYQPANNGDGAGVRTERGPAISVGGRTWLPVRRALRATHPIWMSLLAFHDPAAEIKG
jgi:cytochrome d ubiquinol oxidase subunit I